VTAPLHAICSRCTIIRSVEEMRRVKGKDPVAQFRCKSMAECDENLKNAPGPPPDPEQ
jgi:hypothetical protein